MNGHSKDDVYGNDQIPIVIRPKVEIKVSLDVLDDPGEADTDEVENSEGVVRGEDNLGGVDDRRVCNIHNDLEEDVERTQECVYNARE